MIAKSVSIVILALALAVGFGCRSSSGETGASSQKTASTSEIKIDNFTFGPAELKVTAGTTVTWVNKDDIPHTVVSTDEAKTFKSKVLDTDEKFSFTFTKPGTYSYFCSIHPKMTGKVTVT
jgi:amicyanin